MPLVTVILTSFNHDKYIREAIDSVLNQTFTDFELIIWDDASTDETWEIINSYTDSRIIKFRNDAVKRGVFGINKAISEISKGEYIAIHHSDDVWEATKLDKQIELLSNNSNYGAVFTNALAIDEDGASLNDDLHFYTSIFTQKNRSRYEWLNYFFCKGNALCHPSVLIRKKCYEDCGLYRYGFAQLGDFDMWVRLCMKNDIYVMPEKLIRFRVRRNENNTSGNTLDMRSRYFFEYYLIIKNFLNMASFLELVSIFPGAVKYKSDIGESIEFVWSMILIDEDGFALSKLLALELLFNIINDQKSSKLVLEAYGFDVIDFVDLTRKYGITNKYIAEYESEIRRCDAIINERDAAINERDAAINERDAVIKKRDSLISSKSWKITKPLRYAKAFFKDN